MDRPTVGSVQILRGNALALALADESVDLIVTSPRTTDPKQLAKAARRPFVPPAEQTEGQLDLLEGIA